MELEDKIREKYEVLGLQIKTELQPRDLLRTPEGNEYKGKSLYSLLQDKAKTEYDTWCRHSD